LLKALAGSEKAHFYSTSLGSTTEVQNQILIAKDVKYINDREFQKIAEQTIIVYKLINGLIKSSKNHNS